MKKQQELVEEIREKKSCIEALEGTNKIQETEYERLSSEIEVLERRNKDLAVTLFFFLILHAFEFSYTSSFGVRSVPLNLKKLD